ncbi:MAG: polysaccharide deacetylase family protein [Niabella sp.]
MYFIKTPWWLKKIYNKYLWDIPTKDKNLYLTFDDGPHPVATCFALDTLQRYNAKATFFCIGKNVLLYPEIYNRIEFEKHAIGNHTHNHYNGWKTNNTEYLNNIGRAAEVIKSNLYRPPYGRIKHSQGKALQSLGYHIIMWDVLSGDFDRTLSRENCLKNVTEKATTGSIIVFHDSEKAYNNMSYALPHVLDYFSTKGFRFNRIEPPYNKTGPE